MYVYVYVYSIHVHVCNVYTVCHEYIYTCTYLFGIHLDIILLVVSDGNDSTKGWKSLFENPGVIEGSASSTTSSSICFNIDGPMLSPTPRGLGNLLDSPTVGVTAGEALAAAGSGCKIAIAAVP